MRGCITRVDDVKLAEDEPSWSDEQVLVWDENCKDDEALMTVCCERDVEAPRFRICSRSDWNSGARRPRGLIQV